MRIVLIKNDRAGTYVKYLTSGKTYIAEQVDPNTIDPTTIYEIHTYYDRLYKMYSDNDTAIYTTLLHSSHINGEDWEVIETLEV